jgi:catechol 2,3-dioxygenase-like lactoylglutathione lyase family enzyme
MDLKLEVIVVPVSDVDRAKRFYEKLGFRLDIDYVANEDYRVIQFTPPGSAASIIFGKGVTSTQPDSIDGLVLAVYDIDAARGEFLSRGVVVSEVFHDAEGAKWRFDNTTFERTAVSFNNPDHVGIVIHNYRWRLGLAEGRTEVR